MNNNTENAPIIPKNENDAINENNRNKIEPKSNLIFSENDVQISGFNNNGNSIVENKNNRSLLNSEKNKKSKRFTNNEEIYNNTYDKNLFNQLGNDNNNSIKYNYLSSENSNLNPNLKQSNNNRINYDMFSLKKGKNEQIKESAESINENILLKSKISTLEKIIIKYEKQNNDFNRYMNLFYNFFKNINQISMNQLNIDINQFSNNKFIEINAFQNILNEIQNYVAFLLNELNNNLNYTNKNNSNKNNSNNNQNQIEDNYNNDGYHINNNKVYDMYNIQNNNTNNSNKINYNRNINNNNKMNEQYEIYKTLEERINLLEKEINMQKQNFNNNINNNAYDIRRQNGTERIKKKRSSKKKLKTVNNIYEISQEEPKIFDIKAKQTNNKKVKIINNIKDNQKNQLKENKMIFNSNRKYRFNIKDKENKKRSVTPLNSKLKKYFN